MLERRHKVQNLALVHKPDTDLPDEATEADEMFYSYSIVNTNAFDEFAERLNRLIEALSFFELEYKSEEYVYEYEGEYLVDLGRFLRYISKGNQKPALLFLAFNQFYTSQLISYHKINPTKLKQNNSGLSLFYPRTIEEIPRYHYLDFYQEVKMSTIFEKIIKA